jgi:purine-binding chemotaxis protein CheW
LLFRVGEDLYALGVRRLRQVFTAAGVTDLPTPPYQFCAMLAYRGRRVPVIRMRELFGVPATEGSGIARVLMTQGVRYPFGLLVDEVLGLIAVDPTRIAPVPSLATLLDPRLFRGLFSRQDQIVLLVDEDGLGAMDDIARFYASAA